MRVKLLTNEGLNRFKEAAGLIGYRPSTPQKQFDLWQCTNWPKQLTNVLYLEERGGSVNASHSEKMPNLERKTQNLLSENYDSSWTCTKKFYRKPH